ncbi:hypothetical protein CR513_46680, partial [Mucuna pruriens]
MIILGEESLWTLFGSNKKETWGERFIPLHYARDLYNKLRR